MNSFRKFSYFPPCRHRIESLPSTVLQGCVEFNGIVSVQWKMSTEMIISCSCCAHPNASNCKWYKFSSTKSDFHGSWRAIAIEAMMHGAFQILEQLHLGVEPVVETLGCFRGLLLLRIRQFTVNLTTNIFVKMIM